MTQSLKSLTEKAKSKQKEAEQDYITAQTKLTSHAQNLHAEFGEKLQKIESSTLRRARYFKWFLISILAIQISILLLSPKLILEAKLKWLNSPQADQSPITLQQLKQIQPTMTEADLAIIRALEALSAEHENRLIELEESLNGLQTSASKRSDQEDTLLKSLDELKDSQEELRGFVTRFVKHYKTSMSSISARLDALESRSTKQSTN